MNTKEHCPNCTHFFHKDGLPNCKKICNVKDIQKEKLLNRALSWLLQNTDSKDQIQPETPNCPVWATL